MIDTVEISRAVRTHGWGTEAPPRSAIEHWITRLMGARRAHRRRELLRVLALVTPGDVHRARTGDGLTTIERFALTEGAR
jgi:hypothetical protein